MKGGSNHCSGPFNTCFSCCELSALRGKRSDAVDHHKASVGGYDMFKSSNVNHLFSLSPNQSSPNSCLSLYKQHLEQHDTKVYLISVFCFCLFPLQILFKTSIVCI